MEKVIFFIRYSGQLPVEFFYLSQAFLKYDIKLVPVGSKDISELIESRNVHLLSLTNRIQNQRELMVYFKQFLGYALVTSKLKLFDISSFNAMNVNNRAEGYKNYFHFYLPDTIESIVHKVLDCYSMDEVEVLSWPGGRRAKLPTV